MDKGREAIEKQLLHIYMLGRADASKGYKINVLGMMPNLYDDLCMELRSHGWIPPGEGVRLDEVVEGRTVLERTEVCPDLKECEDGNAFRCPSGWKATFCKKGHTRPATVADLIGRKK